MEHQPSNNYNGVLAFFSDALGTVKVVDSGYGITNGPIMDRKNQFLFHTDSKKRIIYKLIFDQEKIKSKNIFKN